MLGRQHKGNLFWTNYYFLGNYHTIGEELANDNILAFGHDHIGHGQSDGIPAYIEDVDDYVDDLVEHCKVKWEQQFTRLGIVKNNYLILFSD